MQFYLAKGTEKRGPFTRYQVNQFLASGEYGPNDLGWHDDLDGWKPLAEIPVTALMFDDLLADKEQAPELPSDASPPSRSPSVARTPLAALEEYGCRQARPFVRFYARSIDNSVFIVLCWILLGGFEIPASAREEGVEQMMEALRPFLMINFTIVFAWNFVEAWLLSTYGTTLGKYLLRIEVRDADGNRLRYLQALHRSLFVWVAGFGLGFAFLLQALHIIQFFQLTRTGLTTWDRILHLKVTHRKIGDRRIAIAFAILIAIFFAMNLVVRTVPADQRVPSVNKSSPASESIV